MRAAWRVLTSLRTAAFLLAVLAVLLLAGVAIPQRAVVGEEAFAALAGAGGVRRLVLVDLGLGEMATSPLFGAVLALVFVNLVCVLVDRTGVTVRRARLRAPSEDALRRRRQEDYALERELPPGWTADTALSALKGLGYRRVRVGPRAVWGVRHRFAPFGFVVFHVSFLLLLAGGILLHMTRFVAVAAVAEGQLFTGDTAHVVRRSPWGAAPDMAFTLERSEVVVDRGEPVRLAALLRFSKPASPALREASINHPVRVGATTVLVERAGLAPVLWLQDGRGFTLDRVVVVAPPDGGATEVPLAGGRLVAAIEPVEEADRWPTRAELQEARFTVTVREGGAAAFDGSIAVGHGVRLGSDWLAVADVRPWVGLRIVRERGGTLLVAGFALGILGLVWRLSRHRRELVIMWDDDRLAVTGRSELFHRKFRTELDGVARLVAPGDWRRLDAKGDDASAE